MKLLSATFLLALSLAACSKKDSVRGPAGPFSLTGKWRLTRIAGGIGGINIPASNYKTILFRSDSTCTFNNDGTISNATFNIRKDNSYRLGRPVDFLFISGEKCCMITGRHDTLELSQDVADGMGEIYRKE